MSEAKQHGGFREGAGRPPILKNAIRRNITFDEIHLVKLKKFAERNGLKGYSDAIRLLIDSHT
jgi:hypothetical protein